MINYSLLTSLTWALNDVPKTPINVLKVLEAKEIGFNESNAKILRMPWPDEVVVDLVTLIFWYFRGDWGLANAMEEPNIPDQPLKCAQGHFRHCRPIARRLT